MGNATPDHVGMHRTEQDAHYSSAVVALDVATGQVRWHFQTVYHDLWDFDLPAQPVLFDMPMKGGSAPAVAVPTKQGEIYILDRRTGKPLTAVEERPVPQGTIPGERYAPVQPFSVGFPSFDPPALRERDMWGGALRRSIRCGAGLPIDPMIMRVPIPRHRCAGRSSIPAFSASSTGAA